MPLLVAHAPGTPCPMPPPPLFSSTIAYVAGEPVSSCRGKPFLFPPPPRSAEECPTQQDHCTRHLYSCLTVALTCTCILLYPYPYPAVHTQCEQCMVYSYGRGRAHPSRLLEAASQQHNATLRRMLASPKRYYNYNPRLWVLPSRLNQD